MNHGTLIFQGKTVLLYQKLCCPHGVSNKMELVLSRFLQDVIDFRRIVFDAGIVKTE